MIPKTEFYFVRHGQTDHNISKEMEKKDHPAEIPLNATGRSQAQSIEPIIASLPIQTICCSPFRRAQETKEIITPRLSAPHREVPDLGECSSAIWKTMYTLGPQAPHSEEEPLFTFMQRVKRGLNHALSLAGPVLIVAHGGVHFAMCSLMNIAQHEWLTDNCVPIRFFVDKEGHWKAQKLKRQG